MAEDRKRLIEVDFPLREVSIDSVHEKMCHSGHPKSFHLWPARRPLAACRAALIAALLPDPGNDEERKAIYKRLAGELTKVESKGVVKTETKGGILRWKRATENAEDLEWFREEICKVYEGRAPEVLDPFAGGGAIPLEAMRMGCKATAVDISPVAFFTLKCTLEYPQQFSGQTRPLPEFVLKNRDFMEEYYKKACGLKGKQLLSALEKLGLSKREEGASLWKDTEVTSRIEADLAWHVRAWGMWVREQARTKLAPFYPVIDNKPAVAYLWARTVECKNCRATIPLLKTLWLCRKANKRVLLTMQPNEMKTGAVFSIDDKVPVAGGNASQKSKLDERLGAATMTASGVKCVCCPAITTREDLRYLGKEGKIGYVNYAVVVNSNGYKQYRIPVAEESCVVSPQDLSNAFNEIPFGIPTEPVPKGGSRSGGGSPFTIHSYGLEKWSDLFLSRQLLTFGTLLSSIRAISSTHPSESEWDEAIKAYLFCALDKLIDFCSTLVAWQPPGETGGNTFTRWALQMKYDFVESAALNDGSASWKGMVEWITRPLLGHLKDSLTRSSKPNIILGSALKHQSKADLILTDPPYYDEIPYSDCTDFFYVWLRRALFDNKEFQQAFSDPLQPKWDQENFDGELIDDPSRFNGDKRISTATYEKGLDISFRNCHKSLANDGRLIIVFASKEHKAWESLVSATIRAGFTTLASWPIQTEMMNRTRAMNSAALSSSIWLVCRKRDPEAKAGWDTAVLEEMRENITDKLRRFWDDGIRGPDFVWSATGPALEAYSKHPVVKKTDKAGELMSVGEFLIHVRRIVVDFIVGNVLGSQQGTEVLDEATTYYLLHRYDFGTDAAPAGAVILYATACGLTDGDLTGRYDILASGKTSSKTAVEDENGDEPEADGSSGSKSEFKLQPWNRRKGKNLGMDTKNGRPIPLIDQLHKLMHLWKAADVGRVNNYIDERRIQRNELFKKVQQALIELSTGSERAMLESISNHLKSRGDSATTLFDK